jgi:hypothetical protein
MERRGQTSTRVPIDASKHTKETIHVDVRFQNGTEDLAGVVAGVPCGLDRVLCGVRFRFLFLFFDFGIVESLNLEP